MHDLARADHPTTSPAERDPGKLWLRFAANGADFDARMIGWWNDGWDKFPERVQSHVAALEQSESFKVHGIQVHHPWGRSIEDDKPTIMEFQQRQRCQEEFSRSGNPVLELALDDGAFVRAMNAISKDHRLMIYLGAPHQLDPLPGETKSQWVERAKAVYGPVLQITPPPAIGMDNTYGHPRSDDPNHRMHFLGGAEGSLAQLTHELTSRGHEVYFEGAILFQADWARKLCSTYTTEQWWWVPAAGRAHGKPGWGRWARLEEETGNTTMIQLLPRDDDDQKRTAIQQHLDLGRDVTVEVTECPGYPWK